jgi:hypothetical protein
MEDVVPLEKAEKEKPEIGTATLLSSKKALRAFHEKCLDFASERNVTYLSPDDLTELLGGSSDVKPSFVIDVMNTMVANVLF